MLNVTNHEKWADGEFSNVLDYLSSQNVDFNGSIILKWLAAPYISIWVGRATKLEGHKIWVFHNTEFSDYVITNNITKPREALLAFKNKWQDKDFTSLRRRDIRKTPLESNVLIEKHIGMIKNVANDNSLWEE